MAEATSKPAFGGVTPETLKVGPGDKCVTGDINKILQHKTNTPRFMYIKIHGHQVNILARPGALELTSGAESILVQRFVCERSNDQTLCLL